MFLELFVFTNLGQFKLELEGARSVISKFCDWLRSQRWSKFTSHWIMRGRGIREICVDEISTGTK